MAVAAAGVAAAGCADILGIDDGIQRVPDASIDAGGSDAAPDVKDAAAEKYDPLHCGAAACNFAAGQSCCWDDGGFSCVTSANACSGVYIPCDRPEQCAQGGDAGAIVCCAHYVSVDGGGVADDVACLPADQCNAGSDRVPLCGDDSGVECGDAATCTVSSFTLPTFLFCK